MKEKLTQLVAEAAAKEATRKGLQKLEGEESLEQRLVREARERKRKALWWLGGGVLGLVVVVGLMTQVFEWLLIAGFVGAVGYGGWMLLRPRLKRLGAARAEARAAREAVEARQLAAHQAETAAREAEAAKEAKAQALEDELAALKARSGKGS